MKKLSILHVGNHTLPCVGGIENVIWYSAREQAARGHEVHILVFDTCTNRKTILPGNEEREGVHIHRVPEHGPLFYRLPPISDVLRLAKGMDVVHVHGIGAWLDILCMNRAQFSGKLVLNSHGGFFHTTKRRLLKKIYQGIWVPFSWKKIDHVIFDSEQDKAHFSTIRVENTVIPNMVDVNPLLQISLAKKNPSHALFVGRLSSNKRVDRLIHAWVEVVKRVPDAILHLAGEDWEGIRPALEKIVENHRLEKNILFHGKVSDDMLTSLYAQSGLFVSASEYEGFGVSTIEAMAAGCIPVVNRIPTFEEFVTHSQSGFLVDFSSPRESAETLVQFMRETSKKRAIHQKNARSYAKKFLPSEIVKKQIQVYETV